MIILNLIGLGFIILLGIILSNITKIGSVNIQYYCILHKLYVASNFKCYVISAVP